MSIRRLLLSPLLLLVALATVLGAGTVSASATHGPETRVRAFDTVAVDGVSTPRATSRGLTLIARRTFESVASLLDF
ncbi:MAG: hypothetical protein K8R99_02640 [Actinomycetia bacterium]|nr:hypothetical protein [Actinomycetes bacterium]